MGAFSGYREVRATMAAYGDAKPIWLTQFGWSTTTLPGQGVSPETQADYLTRAYECLEQDPYVEVAMWFSLRNQSGDDTWRGQLGMMSRNFTPKPAYDALKDYVPGAGGCSYEAFSCRPRLRSRATNRSQARMMRPVTTRPCEARPCSTSPGLGSAAAVSRSRGASRAA